MPNAPLLARSEDYALYELPGHFGAFGVVRGQHEAQRGPAAVPWEPALTRMLRQVFGERRVLFRSGPAPVFLIRGRPIICECSENAYTEIHSLAPPGAYRDDPPDELAITSPAQSATNLSDMWREICRANEIRPATYTQTASTIRMINSLANHSSVPTWGGILRHPVVGELPAGWFGVPEPPNPQPKIELPPGSMLDGPKHLLRTLFAPLPLDEASHIRLYAYLLACFHADSLTFPVPLLAVDSWTQGMGKTEACSAIAELVNGSRSSLAPPRGNGSNDETVAHFNAGNRMVCYDNLTCDNRAPWNNAWLCTLLSDRQASARVKYQASSSSFAGRLATLTFIFGDAVLHPDLISRSWRVQLWGSVAGPLSHRPNRFAEEYRDALQAACYWTVKEAPPWPDLPLSGSRCNEFEAIGVAAYCHLFGKAPEKVSKILRENEKDACALSAGMIKFIKAADPNLGVGGEFVGQRLTKEERIFVDGARALGYRAVVKDKRPTLEKVDR